MRSVGFQRTQHKYRLTRHCLAPPSACSHPLHPVHHAGSVCVELHHCYQSSHQPPKRVLRVVPLSCCVRVKTACYCPCSVSEQLGMSCTLCACHGLQLVLAHIILDSSCGSVSTYFVPTCIPPSSSRSRNVKPQAAQELDPAYVCQS